MRGSGATGRYGENLIGHYIDGKPHENRGSWQIRSDYNARIYTLSHSLFQLAVFTPVTKSARPDCLTIA